MRREKWKYFNQVRLWSPCKFLRLWFGFSNRFCPKELTVWMVPKKQSLKSSYCKNGLVVYHIFSFSCKCTVLYLENDKRVLSLQGHCGPFPDLAAVCFFVDTLLCSNPHLFIYSFVWKGKPLRCCLRVMSSLMANSPPPRIFCDFCCYCFSFFHGENGTQGLWHIRQVSYHWVTLPSHGYLFLTSCYSKCWWHECGNKEVVSSLFHYWYHL
jgi:hypothetical protein